MCCGDDVRTRRMHLGVDGKGRGIRVIVAFHHLAAMINQDQVRDEDLAKVNPERIHPEVIPAFWIAGGDVACHSFVEAEAGKEPEGSGKPLFAMLPLLFHRSKGRRFRNAENVGRYSGHVSLLRLHSQDELYRRDGPPASARRTCDPAGTVSNGSGSALPLPTGAGC